MPETTITFLPPPSVNRTNGKHWTVQRRLKRALQTEIEILLLAAGLPAPVPGDRVHATAVAIYPIERRRDEGNLRAPIEKALGDALQQRWLSDDTPEHFTFGPIDFRVEPRRTQRVELTLLYGPELAQTPEPAPEALAGAQRAREAPRMGEWRVSYRGMYAHLHVVAPLDTGRLRRGAGSALCDGHSSARRPASSREPYCAQCLRLAQRHGVSEAPR
jgi:hypothetical protein